MSRKGAESVAVSTPAVQDVLLGRHDYALDPKKRVTIPSEWRHVFQDVVYVMPDRKEKCLDLYPRAEMEVLLASLRQRSLFDPAAGNLWRKLGEVSQQLPLDSQGRIRICDKLLRFANLTTTVAMVGSVRMVKLYDPSVLGSEDDVDIASLDAAMSAAGL